MASSLWQSFVEAVAPGHDQPVWGQAGSHHCMVGRHLLTPDVTQHGISHNIRVGESDTDSEVEFQDSREDLPFGGLEGP